LFEKRSWGDFEKKTVESIFEELIEFPAFVKTNGDRIIVTFHGNYKVTIKRLLRKY